MSQNLALAVQISLLGMGLVFASIFILWGVIAALTRLAAERTQAEAPEPVKLSGAQIDDGAESDRLRRVAAAAVVVAWLRENKPALPAFPLPPTSIVSAWQAVTRSNILNKRGPTR